MPTDAGDLLREIAFRWRSFSTISAPAWKRCAGSWQRLTATLEKPATTTIDDLRTRFGADLDEWPKRLTVHELHEAVYLIDVLDRYLNASGVVKTPGLDVGAKNGTALPALANSIPGPWDLVEIDAHRRYATLATRRAHGTRIARHYPRSRFIAGSVTELPGPYGVVTWILPFIDPAPLAAWGLPKRLFEPERLLAHVKRILTPGGTLFVVNQGKVEYDIQRDLFRALDMSATPLGRIESTISPFKRERYSWRWTAPA
ncbi:MAG: class I SAM-dependent methyltransferase [Chloroflexi bacterium]|nr:class I SAM-dependent methyltransferase [Chloroflexota bacterium]